MAEKAEKKLGKKEKERKSVVVEKQREVEKGLGKLML